MTSVDTDVIFIGLTMEFPTNTVIIKANAPGKPSKYLALHMDKLQDAIHRTLILLVYQPPSELEYNKKLMHYQAVILYLFLSDLVRQPFSSAYYSTVTSHVGQELLPGDLSESSEFESGLQSFYSASQMPILH